MIRAGEPFTQAELDEGAVLDPVEPAPEPAPIEQDEHWPADWAVWLRSEAAMRIRQRWGMIPDNGDAK